MNKTDTKNALLEELNSIKDFLDNDDIEIPTLEDAVAPKASNEKALNETVDEQAMEIPTLAEVIDDNQLVDILEADVFSAEDEGSSAQVSSPDIETTTDAKQDVNHHPKEHELPLGVLPGQQSLFEPSETDKAPSDSGCAEHTEIQATGNESVEVDFDEQPSETEQEPEPEKEIAKTEREKNTAKHKKTSEDLNLGENPFLPKHIRDRLGSSLKSMDAIVQQQPFTSESYTFPETKEETEPQIVDTAEMDAAMSNKRIIDDIVAKYLPKIEAELRFRLKAQLNDADDTESTP